MHIDVSEIMSRSIGERASFKIVGERPDLDDVELASAIDGEVNLIRTDFGLAAQGEVDVTVTLECHRCLRSFPANLPVKVGGEFALTPPPVGGEDQWPIEQQRQRWLIDIAPMVRQEIILALPAKLVCEPDCLGLCPVCGQRQEDQRHPHSVIELNRNS